MGEGTTPRRWQVWRGSPTGSSTSDGQSYRWRWLARLVAWEHTKRGWFDYFVRDRDAGERQAP